VEAQQVVLKQDWKSAGEKYSSDNVTPKKYWLAMSNFKNL
jgi:hypothetical protein